MLIGYASDVAIEVTRRCNMKCAHCLRGDAQNMDITHEIIDKFLDGFGPGACIGSLLFTGGEITLNLDAIRYMLQAVKERKISVMSFYMVTNGKEISLIDELVRVAIDWYVYADDNELTGLALSHDPFHEKLENWGEIKRTLSALSFFSSEDKDMYKQSDIILTDEGRAKNLVGFKKRAPYISFPEIYETQNGELDISGSGRLYLSSNGNIAPDCDMSYNHIDACAMANVNDKDWVDCFRKNCFEENPLFAQAI